jgi:hypothetical protein
MTKKQLERYDTIGNVLSLAAFVVFFAVRWGVHTRYAGIPALLLWIPAVHFWIKSRNRSPWWNLWALVPPIGVVVYYLLKSNPPESEESDDKPAEGGFIDWVQDVDYRKALSEEAEAWQQELEDFREFAEPSPQLVGELADGLLGDHTSVWNNSRKLEILLEKDPDRVAGWLWSHASNPKRLEKFLVSKDDVSSPIDVIVGMVASHRPQGLREFCLSRIEDPLRTTRRAAYAGLASDLSAEAIDALLPLFTSKADTRNDESMRTWALANLFQAIEQRGLVAESAGKVVQAFSAYLPDCDYECEGYAVSILLLLDADAGVRLIDSPEFLNPDRPHAAQTVVEFERGGHRLSDANLEPFLSALFPLRSGYAYERNARDILSVLSVRRHPRARECAEEALASHDGMMVSAGFRAILELEDLGTVMEKIWDVDLGELPKPLAGLRCFLELKAEVDNGGFTQFFANCRQSSFAPARDFCREADMGEFVHIMDEVETLFAPGGIPKSNDQMIVAIAKASAKHGTKFGELDTEFYDFAEGVEAHYLKLLLRHRDAIANWLRDLEAKQKADGPGPIRPSAD